MDITRSARDRVEDCGREDRETVKTLKGKPEKAVDDLIID